MIKTVIGFDFGTKRIGVAVGQIITHTAQPLLTLNTHKGSPPWEKIEGLIKEWQPDRLVVGLPYNEGYEDNKTCEAAMGFISALKSRFLLPVETIDEHLTSFAARKIMAERGIKPNKISLDAMAATLILESWLQSHDKT